MEATIKLTPKEREIALLIIQGMGNKQIAATTGLSSQGVQNRKARLREKVGAVTCIQMIYKLAKAGLI